MEERQKKKTFGKYLIFNSFFYIAFILFILFHELSSFMHRYTSVLERLKRDHFELPSGNI